MFFKKKNKETSVDNHDKECYPLNQRVEDGGWTYAATCSLCGANITLWPYMQKKCSNCLAIIIHGRF